MTTVPATAAVPASIGRRIGAYAIDIAIAWGIQIVIICIGAGVVIGSGANRDQRALAAALLLMYLVTGLVSLVWALVYTAMQGGKGSIGQRAVKLRLADAATGGRIGFWRALGRNIIWVLAGSIVVGYFSPLFDSSGRRQGWHDMVAKAIVIDAKATDAAPRPASATAPPVANPFLPPPAGAVSPALPTVPPAPPAPQFASVSAAAAPSAPFAGGFAPAGAPPVPQSGLISVVPGVTSDPAVVAAARATPAATVAAPAPATRAVPTLDAGDDLDATRAVAPRVPGRPAIVRDSAALAVLTWDDGTRAAIYGRTLFGRNPAAEGDATVIAVRDETLSLSKTHFEVGGDASGLWVVDRHSTNGTTLVRDGARSTLVAGTPTSLRPGDRLEFGDRSATVSAT